MTLGSEAVKPHISPSRVNTFLKCGEQYRRRYIEGDVIPPGVAMIRGTSVHVAAEKNYIPKIESKVDLPKADIIAIAADTFDKKIKAEGVHLNDDEKSIGKKKVLGEGKDVTVALAGLFADELAPTIQPKLVEHKVRISLPKSSHDLLGIIDLVDDEDYIRDLKTSKKKKSQFDVDSDFQFGFYPLIYKAKFGKFPKGIKIDTLLAQKTPKLQTIETTRNKADYQALLARVNVTIDGIKTGVFAPAPTGSWWCAPKWCGYYKTCPYVNGGK